MPLQRDPAEVCRAEPRAWGHRGPSWDPQEDSHSQTPRGACLAVTSDTEVTSCSRLGTSAPELGSTCPLRRSREHPGLSSSTHPATCQGCRVGEAEAPGAPPSPPALCRKGALPAALYAQRPQESLATDVGVQWGVMVAPRTLLPSCSWQFVSRGAPSPGTVPPKIGPPPQPHPGPPGEFSKSLLPRP